MRTLRSLRSVALVSALGLLLVSGPIACSDDSDSAASGGSGGAGTGAAGVGGAADGGAGEGGNGGAPAVTPDVDEVELRLALRALFQDRVVWTRSYLVDTIEGLPGQSESAARLMKNGEDFGSAITPFYGAPAGEQLTALMNEAVSHAAEAVDAALAGDTAGFEAARDAWYATADDVAAFLASANPVWVEADVAALLKTCIDDAIAEATARMTADYPSDLAAFEAHKGHAMMIADALAAGIGAQFPEKVGPKGTPAKVAALRSAMRDLFFDRSTFVRFFLTDAIADLPSLPDTVARLTKNDHDIGDAIKPFYGDAAGDQLAALLDAGLGDASDAVAAAKAGDNVAFVAARDSWYAHADETAAFLASANPNWPEADLKLMLRTCIDDALSEASARLAGDWPAEVAAHDTLSLQARSVADALGGGVAAQFP